MHWNLCYRQQRNYYLNAMKTLIFVLDEMKLIMILLWNYAIIKIPKITLNIQLHPLMFAVLYLSALSAALRHGRIVQDIAYIQPFWYCQSRENGSIILWNINRNWYQVEEILYIYVAFSNLSTDWAKNIGFITFSFKISKISRIYTIIILHFNININNVYLYIYNI